MNKGLEYSKILHTFICEMENTLNDKNKRNRAYAPQVFWKNKYTLELIETELKRLEELEDDFQVLRNIFEAKDNNELLQRIEKMYDRNIYLEKDNNSLRQVNKDIGNILRIIKEKKVNVGLFLIGYGNCDYSDYERDLKMEFQIIEQVSSKPLTQAEFDLLKGWLK